MNLRRLSTDQLRTMKRWLEALPRWMFRDLRIAVWNEITARDVALIAEASDSWPALGPEGLQ